MEYTVCRNAELNSCTLYNYQWMLPSKVLRFKFLFDIDDISGIGTD